MNYFLSKKAMITNFLLIGFITITGCKSVNFPSFGNEELALPSPTETQSPTSTSWYKYKTQIPTITPYASEIPTPYPTLIYFPENRAVFNEQIPHFGIDDKYLLLPTIQAPTPIYGEIQLPANWYLEVNENVSVSELILRHYSDLEGIYRGWGAIPNNFQFSDRVVDVRRVCSSFEDCDALYPGYDYQIFEDGKLVYEVLHKDLNASTSATYKMWAFNDNWMLEIRKRYDFSQEPIVCPSDVIINGKSSNELYGFDSSFSSQLISGKPFFFFERAGQFGFLYDFEEYELGFSRIEFYCGGDFAGMNPTQFVNGVYFHATDNNDQEIIVLMGLVNSN